MTRYSIQVFAIYSRAVGRRLVSRHRAQRIAAWLNRRPAKVTKP